MEQELNPSASAFRVAHADLAASQRAEVARLANCSVGHLRNVSYGLRPLTPAICAAVERVSAGKYSADVLMPSVRWARIPDRRYPHPCGRPAVEPVGE